MATTRIPNVRLAGVASAVPDTVVTAADDATRFGEEEMRRLVKNTGVRRRHVALNILASDLCELAAARLMDDLGWARDSVDALVFVTQSPDYPTPATACLLQDRLGLPTTVAAFDVNLGCSAYTYGLMVAGSLLASGAMKRALLLVGDVSSRLASPHDRAVYPLFGDAGSATALEFDPAAADAHFLMGTDGRGGRHLHNRHGGWRHRFHPGSWEVRAGADGTARHEEHTYMNGAEVLTFALGNLPPLFPQLRALAGWGEADVDAYVFHQASEFMLKNIARSARLPADKVVMALDGYGNASGASIPLAMNAAMRERLSGPTPQRLVLTGFGVGWSWCTAAVTCSGVVLPEVLVVPDVAREAEF